MNFNRYICKLTYQRTGFKYETEIYEYCKNIPDCLLKRIVDKCKHEKDKGFVMSRNGCKVPVSDGYDLASEILKMLDIEECENE